MLELIQTHTAVDARTRRIRAITVATAVVAHLIVLGMLIYMPRHEPVRVTVAHEGGIAAFVNVAMPVGTTGTRPQPAKPKPVPKAPAVMPTQMPATTADSPAAGEAPGAAQGGGAPVRMSVGQVQLIKRVEPRYPPRMLSAHQEATVVLDAVINGDGTIGDITVLQSANLLFDRAAMDAVKQWQYSPIGFQAVVTVTVKFTLR